jgi:hypothetical protein
MRIRLLVFALPVIATIALASVAYGDPATTDMARAEAAGWDCAPAVPIAGQYQHCSQPGKPSVVELLSSDGVTDPSVQLRVYNFADKSFAGTETLIREDLHNPGQKCTQDAANLPGGVWSLLQLPSGNNYYACHRFERTTTS